MLTYEYERWDKLGHRSVHVCVFIAGNLALSRALGDFVFKKNNMKQPEEQIVTGLPYLRCHCSLSLYFINSISDCFNGVKCN